MIKTAHDWIASRYWNETKALNTERMDEIFRRMSGYPDASYVDNRGFISFSEGSPVIHLMRLFRLEHFRFTHKPTGLWMNYPINEGDVGFYLANTHKYRNDCTDPYKGPSYDGVFILQNPDSLDRHHTIKALCWASESKTRIVFKAHPCQGDQRTNREVWTEFEQKGLTSEYTLFDDTTDNALLIENARFVISCQSAVSVQAMLMGKVSVTTKAFDWSEVIPVVSDFDQVAAMSPVNDEAIRRFLSWHRHVYSIDLHADDCMDRIKRRIDGLKQTPDLTTLLRAEMYAD